MIVIIILMKVAPEKRKELSQTIISLKSSIETEAGCRRFELFQSMDDECVLGLLEEWQTKEDLATHMKSENRIVLQGAMNLLVKPWEMLSLNSFPHSVITEHSALQME